VLNLSCSTDREKRDKERSSSKISVRKFSIIVFYVIVVPWVSRVHQLQQLFGIVVRTNSIHPTMIQLANVSHTVRGPLATAEALVVLATINPR